MKCRSFTMQRERDVSIHVCSWQPDSIHNVKGIIQLAHGMAEHIGRYEAFSSFLVEQGYVVYGNDHRGHGQSITAPDDRGFFAEEHGFEKAVGDMRALSRHIQSEHPNLPLFLFGHSMGSFLSRRYIQLYGQDLAGAILSGTGTSQGVSGKLGYLIAKWERFRKGPRAESPLMNQLIFGSYNKAFAPTRTDFDFLSRDEMEVDAYNEDPQCGFICSTSFYMDLIKGIELVHDKKENKKIPTSLPLFIISGEKDPVGDNGKGVRKVYNPYKQLDVEHIQLKLYPNARHEILNETNKEEVYQDILNWLEQMIASK